MTTTATATPKIVGNALYLELVGDNTLPEAQLRTMLGWQHKGTKQVLMFPEYQDDMGKTHSAVIMTRVITENSPRAQWDMTYMARNRPKPQLSDNDSYYANYPEYSNAEWDALTSREQFEARKRAIAIMLKNVMLDTYYSEPDAEGNRTTLAGQGWIVREGKPIAVEITDQDMTELHSDSKTPQAVIRRINKVRTTLDKFPAKLV